MPLHTITLTDDQNIAPCSWDDKEKQIISEDALVLRIADENSPPPASGSLATTPTITEEKLHTLPTVVQSSAPVQSLSCANELSHDTHAPFNIEGNLRDDLTDIFHDVPPPVAANKPRISDVPSECDEDECGDCDTSFWVDGHSNDDVGDTSQDSDYDFSSERFFQEEESSRPSHTFDPDPLSDVLQSLRVEEDMEHVATLATSSRSPPGSVPSYHVPVKCLQVCDHTFKGPTLRMRRLFYLRQMHILMELGRADTFGHARPLIHPVLHAVPPSRGLGWAAERGVVGGWADVDRREPRYITHFRGRPSLLFAEERAVISEASKRAIVVIGQAGSPAPESGVSVGT